MKRTIVFVIIIQLFAGSVLAQGARYEVELLKNPNAGRKDTREVNAVLMFGKDSVKIQSRRSKEIFKEFKYSDIRAAEHSYSRKSRYQMSRGTAIALSLFTGMPLFLMARQKDKHWLVVSTEDDFAVMKIENDNYRLIRLEFMVKKVGVVDIEEDE